MAIGASSNSTAQSLAIIYQLKNSYMGILTNFLNLSSKLCMILFTFYVIYSMKVKFLLGSFIGFFFIKIIGQYVLSHKNPHINPMNTSVKTTESYFINIINNTPLLYLFNCKNIIINRLLEQQEATLLYQKASSSFTEMISSIFNIIDNIQWVLNGILIVTSGSPNAIALIFNSGLTTYFYQRLSWEISFHLPALINNYKTLESNKDFLKYDNEITIDPSIEFKDVVVQGNKIIEDAYILKNIQLNTQSIKTSLKKDFINMGIIGRSGSGKSSLLKSIMGLELLDNPVEFIGGNNIYKDSQLSRQNYIDNIMYISQNKYILEDTLYNNLVLSDKAIDIKKIKEVLSILNIDKNLDDVINDDNLSGGEKSRVNIARSIINTANPSIIVMDELEAALDIITYNKIYNFLMDYPCTKIIATHHSPTMMNMDYLFLLDKGSSIFQGSPQEALKNPVFVDLHSTAMDNLNP
jgi:ABC-type bacteriocin/lantibiotic exporter with double-glycine peptidase domain